MTTSHDLPTIQYDKAGNITALQRNGPNGTLIDNLTYSYTAGTNRLASVTDAVGSTAATWDAETGGFTYDANGNMLTAPAPYGVTAAVYDHRNLPLLLTANGVTSAYRYDEQGQRISKRVTGSNLDEFYILDGRTSLGVVTVDGAGTAVSWTWNVLAGGAARGPDPGGPHEGRVHHQGAGRRDRAGLLRGAVLHGGAGAVDQRGSTGGFVSGVEWVQLRRE
jgi:YD repeat-containing protein